MKNQEFNFIFKIFIIIFVSAVCVIGLERFDFKVSQEIVQVTDKQDIEKIIREALIRCYAIEGAYPYELEYLKKYGVVFDYEKYEYTYNYENSYELPVVEVKLR